MPKDWKPLLCHLPRALAITLFATLATAPSAHAPIADVTVLERCPRGRGPT